MSSLRCRWRMTTSLQLMPAHVTLGNFHIIQQTGMHLPLHVSECTYSSFSRKPENCAYSHPINPPPMRNDNPRAYGLLNSGLVVCNPSEKLYGDIERFLNEDPRVETFQFPDQDLLATFFEGRWRPLPYYYNALKTLRTIHRPLWNDEDVKCLHYILSDKPWTYRPKRNGPPQSEYHDIDLWWWDSFEGLGREFEKINTDESKRAWQYLQTYVASK